MIGGVGDAGRSPSRIGEWDDTGEAAWLMSEETKRVPAR